MNMLYNVRKTTNLLVSMGISRGYTIYQNHKASAGKKGIRITKKINGYSLLLFRYVHVFSSTVQSLLPNATHR